MARVSTYTEETAQKICERLANGESLRAICRSDGMPSQTTVFRWLDDNEAFREQYARAKGRGFDAMADDVVEIADGSGDPVRDRLRLDARRWYLSKLAPKKYGDRLNHEHSGPDGGAIPVLVAVNVLPVRARDD